MKRLQMNKPLKMWIDGKCFNLSPDLLEAKYELDKDSNGLSTSFKVPHIYCQKLLEFDLATLQKTTKTSISVANGELIIRGDSEENIRSGRHKIHSFIGTIRDRIPAAQFLGIPLCNQQIKDNFNKFKAEVLSISGINGMEESIFQREMRLHLTVIVFALMDERERNEAIAALNDYKSTVFDPFITANGPLEIQLSGINCMQDNLNKVNVLYANVKFADENEELSLQKFCNDMSNYFYEKGLVRTYQDHVKLHVTLINTKYRGSNREYKVGAHRRKRFPKRQSFDATKIIEKYKEFHFGSCNLNSIHLSLMSTSESDGYYKPLAKIQI